MASLWHLKFCCLFREIGEHASVHKFCFFMMGVWAIYVYIFGGGKGREQEGGEGRMGLSGARGGEHMCS